MPTTDDAHPDSPAGGGGPGFTAGAKPAGLNESDAWDSTKRPLGRDPQGLMADKKDAPAAAEKKEEKDDAIEALNLNDTAKKAAYELKKKKPSVTFTSGRRDKAEQASAMASNVVQQRDWIKNTYAKSAARDACQKWVDDNKEKKTKDEISAGLKGVLDGLTDNQLAQLSKHLSGDAFDVQPVDKDADDIKKTIRELTGITKFMEKEGNLVRWHAEF